MLSNAFTGNTENFCEINNFLLSPKPTIFIQYQVYSSILLKRVYSHIGEFLASGIIKFVPLEILHVTFLFIFSGNSLSLNSSNMVASMDIRKDMPPRFKFQSQFYLFLIILRGGVIFSM